MGLFVVSLSDVGEGVAEAELVEWHVAVGDTVGEDQLLGVVMTDKAAVDVPSSVLGKVVKLCAEVGDVVAVGADLIHLEVDGDGNAAGGTDMPDAVSASTAVADKPADAQQNHEAADKATAENSTRNTNVGRAENNSKAGNVMGEPPTQSASDTATETSGAGSAKVLAAPSVRQRARELGVDITTVTGSGPTGRVVHDDLERFTERRAQPSGTQKLPDTSINVVKVVGMRRKIAEKMALSKSRIPHITIVEEVDVQYLEELRAELNTKHSETRGKLTILPFVMKSITEAVRDQPELNALYDDEAGEVAQHSGVHIGVAAQTPNGLVVPVVRHSEMNSLWKNASEVVRLAEACRDGSAGRDELSGSTITITSLGPLGAVATTPIINHPEVAIVGVNKMMVRPLWDGQQFVPRKMMNLSCSFDHRVIDGWDAAVFVQKLKSLLEKPAMLFLDD